MFKALFAMFLLPVIGMLVLVGVIVESAQAQPPADATPSAPARSAPPSGGSGGPYEPIAADGRTPDDIATQPEPGAERWRVATDPRQERRFAPAAPRAYNAITLRF